MAKTSGGTRGIEQVKAYEVSASRSNYSERRKEKNEADADALEKQGYKVSKNLHPNGAYAAIWGEHKEHEISVVNILAENGLASTLDKEGNLQIRLKSGQVVTLPSGDGHIEDFTMEIAALTGKPSAGKVADGIIHSYKAFHPMPSKSIQSEVAITITPKEGGERFSRFDIDNGVREFRRRAREGETPAKPKAYLHIDEKLRKVWYRNVKI